MESLVSLTRALFFIALTSMVGVFTYLVWVNPNANFLLYEERNRLLQDQADSDSEALREWNYDLLSDVAAEEDAYPIVVLRTGFKVIRSSSERSLIGWKYEIINTSPSTTYFPTVNFTLQDKDGFDIASGSGDGRVSPKAYEAIHGTISIENVDLERLSKSTWSISLTPSWQIEESSTQGFRYSRLAAMEAAVFPFWTRASVENEFLVLFSEKWAAVKSAIAENESIE